MKSAISRRGFLATLPAFAALAEVKPLKITAVEIWELRGHVESLRGVDQQFQVNPLHIYDELRPEALPGFGHSTPHRTIRPRAYYLKIKTERRGRPVWPDR